MKKGPFTLKESKVVYKNPWIEVREDKVVKPDGTDGIFGTVDYSPGVSVVALTKEREILLIKEYFYVLAVEGIQTPSGGIDAGETPLDAAKRELQEEVGATSSTWIPLGFIQPLTMIIKSPAHLFLALNVEEGQHTDLLVAPLKLSFEEAYNRVLDSKIYHGPSCVAILKANVYLKTHYL
jgi:hypothetical protein